MSRLFAVSVALAAAVLAGLLFWIAYEWELFGRKPCPSYDENGEEFCIMH